MSGIESATVVWHDDEEGYATATNGRLVPVERPGYPVRPGTVRWWYRADCPARGILASPTFDVT
ncbi:hypothetical protein ACNTMW_04550 [Planosporangium sp. 12N6]|uniref:hypothetical protein n=1 Tax=Planosporangium spinosum TaxID=3402278 RepID=UPI003CF88ECA